MVGSIPMNTLRQLARLALLAAAVVASAASASSNRNSPPAVGSPQTTAPQPQPMDPQLAMGLWKSSFGAVKIESNPQAAPNGVHGVWTYDRDGASVIGYFGGDLRGNVLEFSWQEPGTDGAPLAGAGYLVFDPYGQRFTGRWWTSARDRMGEWTGWRQDHGLDQGAVGGNTYGGATYGAQPDDGYVPPPPPGY
jgi:hypothetical protein